MSNIPRISESEWEVMKTLWRKSPLSSNEIIDQLGWHRQTVRTFLGRLVKKEALTFRREGRNYMYEPTFTEEECQKAISKSFLDRVFGGSLKPMLTHLVEEDSLRPKEIDELQKILKAKRKS